MRKMQLIQKGLIIAGVIMAATFGLSNQVEAAENETKIHFISLASTTDAILLESNGHYGMVDSGEDWEYPDGSDERYPFRDGITTGIGYEQQVIHYLKSQGVEKLDFYIATHSHSDHIGSGDEILDAIPTDRLYINRYDDAYMTDFHGSGPNDPYYNEEAQETRLWDNQYVYDDIIDAAKRNDVEIITDLDLEENVQYQSIILGDMSIELMNLDRDRDENNEIIPVSSENNNCIITKITAYGQVALLTSDMEPLDGDTAKIANQLIAELGNETEYQQEENAEINLKESYSVQDYQAESEIELDIPSESDLQDYNRSRERGLDESQVNTGNTISIDLMKMVHHSVDYNNTTYFLTSLNPKTAVVTGYESWFNARERACLPNTKMYATATDSAAVVATFTEEQIQTNYIKISPEWMEINGCWYYFDENGRTFTDQNVHEINGELYCFDQQGAIELRDRWVSMDGKWKYWLASGEFYQDDWMTDENGERYYFDKDGNAVIGWKEIDGNWYYFKSNAALATDAWIGDCYVDESGVWITDAVKDRWILSENRWWYCHGDGSYTRSGWEMIDENWYYFDVSGWMVTGWQQINGQWYYLTSTGVLATDAWIGDCYVDASGIWITDAVKDRWILSGSRWWYCHGDGSYTTSDWEEIAGQKYYFDASGWMVTGWQLIEKNWYYFDASGAMATGAWVGNYYLRTDGKMATDVWIGDYYVDESGLWIPGATKDRWILSGNRWWYCHADESYTTSDWEEIAGQKYYFDASGWMVTGWQLIEKNWYYFDTSGAMVTSAWVGNYYLKANGKMAVSEWVEGGRYYVDENGLRQPMA